MKYLALFPVTLLVFLPLITIGVRKLTGAPARRALLGNLVSFAAMMVLAIVFGFGGSAMAAGEVETAITTASTSAGLAQGLKYIGAALAVGLSGIGGGVAVAAAASSALGAISENEGVFGKALILVGLAEGVALYGLIIALLMIFQ